MKTILILNFFEGLGSFYFHFFKFNVFILWPQLSIHVNRCRRNKVDVLMTSSHLKGWHRWIRQCQGLTQPLGKNKQPILISFGQNLLKLGGFELIALLWTPFLKHLPQISIYMLVFIAYIWWKLENNCIYIVINICMFIKVKNNCY